MAFWSRAVNSGTVSPGPCLRRPCLRRPCLRRPCLRDRVSGTVSPGPCLRDRVSGTVSPGPCLRDRVSGTVSPGPCLRDRVSGGRVSGTVSPAAVSPAAVSPGPCLRRPSATAPCRRDRWHLPGRPDTGSKPPTMALPGSPETAAGTQANPQLQCDYANRGFETSPPTHQRGSGTSPRAASPKAGVLARK